VVDLSSFPTQVSGNTNGPAMAFAWRASEMILEDARLAQSAA
jgi:choline dehydrogenase-like flavoprotein